MGDLKIKGQDVRPHGTVVMILQIIFDGCTETHQRADKRVRLLHHLTALALPFQCKHFLIAFIQIFGNPLVVCLHRPFQFQKGLFAKKGTVHLPAPLHQIVSLVHEKNILAPDSLRKKAAQIHMGIKEIIVITDHRVGKQAHIQTHLKRTYLILARILLYPFPREVVRMSQQLVHRLIHPVIVPLRIGTGCRVTLGLIWPGKNTFFPVHHAVCVLCLQRISICRSAHKADFVLGGQYDAFQFQSPLPQQIDRVVRHGAGDGLGRQIKDTLAQPLPHGFQRRKYRGDRLARARGCLDKELALVVNRLIHISRQLLLPLPVGKRKFHLLDGCLPAFLPRKLIVRPFSVLLHQLLKPYPQFLIQILLVKITDFLRLHMTVSHAHPDIRQFFLRGINISITLRLRQMHGDGPSHFLQIMVGPLDLVYRDRQFLY